MVQPPGCHPYTPIGSGVERFRTGIRSLGLRSAAMAEQRLSLTDYVRGFSRPFWAANVSELFERIAYYGMAPVLVPYLVQVRHFNETSAIRVAGNLGFVVYGVTVLSGMFADWLGY